MTMEVLAAEFPDIFQQFIEIVPDPNKPEQLIYSENENEFEESSPQQVDDGGSSSSSPPALAPDDATSEMTTTRPSSIFMEHDYGQKVFLKDANKNMTKITSQAFINTTFSNEEDDRTQEKMSAFVPVEDGKIHSMANSSYASMIDERIVPDQMTTVCSKPKAELSSPFSELEDILCDLALLHHDHNSNVETLLEAEKSGHGCSWTAGGGCVHGLACTFVLQMLQLPRPAPPPSEVQQQVRGGAAGGRVVLLRQTPHGLVRIPQTMASLPSSNMDTLPSTSSITGQHSFRHPVNSGR